MTTSNYIKLNPNDLANFYGTEHHYYLPPFRHFIYTDGIQYLASQYQMYWLITDIASFLPKIVKNHPDYFYCIILRKPTIGQAELIFTDGNNNQLFTYKYETTSLQFIGNDENGKPIQEMKLFLQEGQNEKEEKNYCLMLPSEY